MIKIIKDGQDKFFIMDCWQCKTTFIYQRDNVRRYENELRLNCPSCQTICHPDFIEYSEESKREWLDEDE